MRLKQLAIKLTLKTRLILTGVVWLVVAGVAFFCSTTGKNFSEWSRRTWQEVVQKSGRSLQQIEVVWQTPNHYTRTDEILKKIGLSQGEAMSQIDLTNIAAQIESLPWVRSVIVERYWPNKLKMTIEEKTPWALWQHNRQYHPLDEEAKIIETTKQLPADLLLVVGADAPEHLILLIHDLEQVPDIYQYVRAAVRINERRWNLKLFDAEKGLEVLLPETGVLDALQRLDAHNKKEKLIRRQLAAIDLRTKDKVVLKPVEQKASDKKKVKK